jgi:hypothetical protein
LRVPPRAAFAIGDTITHRHLGHIVLPKNVEHTQERGLAAIA